MALVIDCVSDLHGELPQLEGGDLLIIAGDITGCDYMIQWAHFFEWLAAQKYGMKILIAGNHDGLLTKECPVDISSQLFGKKIQGFHYLQDSGCEFKGLKIWGSPWTPTFCNWYFMKNRGADIKQKWDLIPDDTDILITHGPPYMVLDQPDPSSRVVSDSKHCGCEELHNAITRVQPRLHVFGHIHGGHGTTTLKCTPNDVLCVNASLMNEDYDPVNKPIRVIL